jgi:hypothetical protein
MEASMNRRISTLAAAVLFAGGIAATSTASANSNFAVSIGLPGFGVGYASNGFGFVAAAPRAYAPYYVPPVAVLPPPFAYAPWYRPVPARLYAPYYYRAPVRVGYYHNHY